MLRDRLDVDDRISAQLVRSGLERDDGREERDLAGRFVGLPEGVGAPVGGEDAQVLCDGGVLLAGHVERDLLQFRLPGLAVTG